MFNLMSPCARRWALNTINADLSRKQYGRDVIIPIRGGIHSWHETETYLLPVIRSVLSARTGAFVDVGASVGQTLLKVKLTSPSIQYLGVEPLPACANYLDELINRNKFQHCTVVCCAVGSAGGVVKLFTRAKVSQVSSLAPQARNEGFFDQFRLVPVISGDQLIAAAVDGDGIAAIKIDVEGSEWDVIRSFRESIAKYRAPVLFEFLPIDSEFVYGAMSDEVIAYRINHARSLRQEFEDHDFDIYQLLGDGTVRKIKNFPALPSHGFEEINFLAVDRRKPSPVAELTRAE